jgi:transcription-repair coupling factor (superfamily II helicase)
MTVSGAPAGYDAYVAAEAAKRLKGLVVFIASDDAHATAACEAARFFAPELDVHYFPAWDCLPYDRVSPRSDIESARLATLAALAARHDRSAPALVVTTINAAVQRVPPRESIAEASFLARTGSEIDLDQLNRFLARNAYSRTGTVREPGEYAPRGGIVDLWPPGTDEPLRLDFFGSRLETIRKFDAESQISSGTRPARS